MGNEYKGIILKHQTIRGSITPSKNINKLLVGGLTSNKTTIAKVIPPNVKVSFQYIKNNKIKSMDKDFGILSTNNKSPFFKTILKSVYSQTQRVVVYKKDYSFIEGENKYLSHNTIIVDYKNDSMFYIPSGGLNTIGDFIYTTGSSNNNLWVLHNGEKYPLKERKLGYIYIDVLISNSANIKNTDVCIHVYNRTENHRFIGEYEIINSSCTVEYLDITCEYDLVLYDRNSIVESSILSKKRPKERT